MRELDVEDAIVALAAARLWLVGEYAVRDRDEFNAEGWTHLVDRVGLALSGKPGWPHTARTFRLRGEQLAAHRAALAAPSRDAGLDAAWAAAEAALPEGWVIDGLARIYAAGTDANGSDADAWSARAYYHGPRGGPVQVAVKETPAAALLALAARLADGAPFPAGVNRADSEGER